MSNTQLPAEVVAAELTAIIRESGVLDCGDKSPSRSLSASADRIGCHTGCSCPGSLFSTTIDCDRGPSSASFSPRRLSAPSWPWPWSPAANTEPAPVYSEGLLWVVRVCDDVPDCFVGRQRHQNWLKCIPQRTA